MQITGRIRFTRTLDAKQYDIPINYLTSTYMKSKYNRERQKRGRDTGMYEEDNLRGPRARSGREAVCGKDKV